MVNNVTPPVGAADQPQSLQSNDTNDALMAPFNEDSQNSLDGISNQPLPDISVQEAEFVLGIPPNSNQATPSQSSFPPNANWSDFMPNQPPMPPPDERTFPPSHNPHMSPHPMGGDTSFMFSPYNDQFSDYRNRMQMSHFMNRQPYMAGPPLHPSPQMDPGGFGGPPHYTAIPNRPQDGHYNSMEWHWSQQRPRLPPPLPPHLQSMSFSIPHSSSSHPSPVASSSRPSTPQAVPVDRASPHRPSSQPGLEPIKIHWQDQQHGQGNSGNTNSKGMGGGVMTPPPSSQLQQQPQMSKDSVVEKEESKQNQILSSAKVTVIHSLLLYLL